MKVESDSRNFQVKFDSIRTENFESQPKESSEQKKKFKEFEGFTISKKKEGSS